jgi:hypothetical protein
MTQSDLVAALQPVTDALDRLGVRYFIGGSVASSAHGIARSSIDVDLIAELETAHVEPLAAWLAPAYYVPVEHMRVAVADRRSFNLIHFATMFKIDVFVSKRRPFDRIAVERATPQSLDGRDDGPRVAVASAEDTVLAKLEWFRRGGETSERQWADVVGVLKVTPGADRNYLRRWAAELKVRDLLDRAFAEAGL